MQPPKLNTFVIPIIRDDLVLKCLETLYKHTPDNFYVYIIDQSPKGLDHNLRNQYKNLMIIRPPKSDVHYTGNLGFQKAVNMGIQLVQTPYVTILNDDVEFINQRWWDGVLATFQKVEKATPTRPPLLVNVASVKLPDWSVGRKKGDDHYILPYKEDYAEEDWDFLVNEKHYVNEHLTITPGTVIDGINLYCSVIDTRRLLNIGLLDEFWYPGTAGDYDLCCLASMFGYRCVGTTLSWVFHHWSQTFEKVASEVEMGELVQNELKRLDLREKWGNLYDKDGNPVYDEQGNQKGKFDLWGIRCLVCDEIMHTEDGIKAACPRHPDQVYAIPESTVDPL
jgi:GT2 family glycosyltransferase